MFNLFPSPASQENEAYRALLQSEADFAELDDKERLVQASPSQPLTIRRKKRWRIVALCVAVFILLLVGRLYYANARASSTPSHLLYCEFTANYSAESR
jgi:ferric-dicitrate binding protein FerR (iron transport regulator)